MSDYNLKILLTANGETTTLDPVLGTPASVELSGLTADTEYEVEIILQSDGSNIDVASDTETFRTLSDIDENTPFYLENLTNDRATFTLTKTGTPTSTDLSYSLDNENWTMFDLTTATNTVEVPNGRIYLRSSTGFSNSTSNYFTLGMSERFSACGNVMNIFNYNKLDSELTEYCFHRLFYGSEYLIDASLLILPATTLADSCYLFMFYNCTNLKTAPAELSATTLADDCYYGMFTGCSSLTTAPELPATTLAERCYKDMFNDCTSLTTAPVLPATTLASKCYSYMFSGCTSLTTAPELPATTLVDYCYQYMFNNCTSLTTAPELPATTLALACYYSMFWGCTNLTTAPELPATTLAAHCYRYMFNDCTSLTTAPVLPATTLAYNCYGYMFYGCTNLQSVTTYVTTWDTNNTEGWLASAGTNATLYCPTDSTLKTYTDNVSGIPTGWTQVDLP